MSYCFNQVTLIGYAGDEPKTQKEDKKAFARVNLATSKQYKKEGDAVSETHWHDVVFFGQLADIAKQYIKKGSHLFIQGELVNNNWQDKEGKKHYQTQILVSQLRVLDKKEDEGLETTSIPKSFQ